MDKPRWNLKSLREHIRQLPGDQRYCLSVVSSLDWSDRIFRYHFSTARDALASIKINDDPGAIENWELMFSTSDEHEMQLLVIRANVIACIYTVRNAYDHLAQLANALVLSKPFPVTKCDLHKVHERLPTSALRHELDLLVESQWFQYVAAYSNSSKHRALVQQSLHLSWEDGVAGIRAESFTHDKQYPAYMVGDLLKGVLDVKNHIIACGQALNAQVMPTNV